MDERERAIRKRLKEDFEHYAIKCLKIRTKDLTIEAFKFNRAQRYLHEIIEQQKRATGKVRIICLKGRQQGCSTYVEARFYWLVTHLFGARAFILTHEIDATNNLFEMAKRYHENCPDVIRQPTKQSNSKQLIFEGIDSGYRLGTAGNKKTGRSQTIQFCHGSEVAFWDNADEIAAGLMQAIPNSKGTEIILESTAQGEGNYFHEQWQKAESGESGYIAVFLPWYWQDEYAADVPNDFGPIDNEAELMRVYGLTAAQIMWRRWKIAEFSGKGKDGQRSFNQEYPMNAAEAFLTSGGNGLIKTDVVAAARKAKCEPYGPLIIGVDPARMGEDRTAIIRRRGRVAYGLECHSKKDTMQIANIVHQIIINEKPDRVCIDIVGLGAGVYDRLVELGYKDILVAVNGGETAFNDKRYRNKRAEMWCAMNDWFCDAPVQIEDSSELHGDLCGILHTHDDKSRVVMEKKEDMKKRRVRSPDTADALAMTFCVPDWNKLVYNHHQTNDVAQAFANEAKRMANLKRKAYQGIG